MARARTDMRRIAADIAPLVERFREPCCAIDEDAWMTLETFIAVAQRVMMKTNPSKIRDVAMTVEIQCRLGNREVIECE